MAVPGALVIDTYGALTFWHRTQEKTRSKDSVEWLASYTAANYDADGLGKLGTEAWGWKLLQGAAGRFPVVLDPASTNYGAVGATGGAATVSLTASQNGRHNHATAGQFNYNQLLRLAPLNSNTTAGSTDGNGNGEQEVDIVSSSAIQDSGNDDPHENRPPFYTLAARQWVG